MISTFDDCESTSVCLDNQNPGSVFDRWVIGAELHQRQSPSDSGVARIARRSNVTLSPTNFQDRELSSKEGKVARPDAPLSGLHTLKTNPLPNVPPTADVTPSNSATMTQNGAPFSPQASLVSVAGYFDEDDSVVFSSFSERLQHCTIGNFVSERNSPPPKQEHRTVSPSFHERTNWRQAFVHAPTVQALTQLLHQAAESTRGQARVTLWQDWHQLILECNDKDQSAKMYLNKTDPIQFLSFKQVFLLSAALDLTVKSILVDPVPPSDSRAKELLEVLFGHFLIGDSALHSLLVNDLLNLAKSVSDVDSLDPLLQVVVPSISAFKINSEEYTSIFSALHQMDNLISEKENSLKTAAPASSGCPIIKSHGEPIRTEITTEIVELTRQKRELLRQAQFQSIPVAHANRFEELHTKVESDMKAVRRSHEHLKIKRRDLHLERRRTIHYRERVISDLTNRRNGLHQQQLMLETERQRLQEEIERISSQLSSTQFQAEVVEQQYQNLSTNFSSYIDTIDHQDLHLKSLETQCVSNTKSLSLADGFVKNSKNLMMQLVQTHNTTFMPLLNGSTKQLLQSLQTHLSAQHTRLSTLVNCSLRPLAHNVQTEAVKKPSISTPTGRTSSPTNFDGRYSSNNSLTISDHSQRLSRFVSLFEEQYRECENILRDAQLVYAELEEYSGGLEDEFFLSFSESDSQGAETEQFNDLVNQVHEEIVKFDEQQEEMVTLRDTVSRVSSSSSSGQQYISISGTELPRFTKEFLPTSDPVRPSLMQENLDKICELDTQLRANKEALKSTTREYRQLHLNPESENSNTEHNMSLSSSSHSSSGDSDFASFSMPSNNSSDAFVASEIILNNSSS